MTTIVRRSPSDASVAAESAPIAPRIDDAMRRAMTLLQSELRAVQLSQCDFCGHYFKPRESRYLGIYNDGETFVFCRQEVRGNLAVMVEVVS